MKIFDLLKTAFGNMFKRKTRTFLTLLGVVLGSASVTLTFAIGDAVKQNNQQILESTGSLKYIEVYTGNLYGNTNDDDSNSNNVYLDDNFIKKIKKIDGVNSIFYSLSVPQNMLLMAGKNDRYQASYGMTGALVMGIDFDEAKKFGLTLVGDKTVDFSTYRFLPTNKTIRAVGGQYFEYSLENTVKYRSNSKRGGHRGVGGPIGNKNSTTRITNSPYFQYIFSRWGDRNSNIEIVPPFADAEKDDVYLAIQYPNKSSTNQVSEYDMNYGEGSSYMDVTVDTNPYKYKKYKIVLDGRFDWHKVKHNDTLSTYAANSIYVDIETAKTLIRQEKKLNESSNSSSSSSTTSSNVPEFQYDFIIIEAKELDNVLDISKQIKKMGYEVYNLMDTIENEQLRAKSNQFILGFLGGLALFVSAISISNTMITSVYERTKEIGIMKVLGCKIGNIQLIFLIESGIIGLLGGCLGLTCSYLLSSFMNKLVAGEVENLGAFAQIISNYVEGMKSDVFGSFDGGVAMKVAVINPNLCIWIILGTTLIGLIAGYIPSVAASRIEALRAIKTNK